MTTKTKRFCYEYARPAVTVDAVVFGVDMSQLSPTLEVLLIERDRPPFEGTLALPGGFLQMNEGLDDAVARELREETGLRGVFLEQLYTFGAPKRDPRGRVVSIAYYGLVDLTRHRPKAGSDAKSAQWYSLAVSLTRELAFDHTDVLRMAFKRLQGKVRWAPVGFELLPETFTLAQLRYLYELILQKPIDRSHFQKKVLAMDLLVEAGKEKSVSHRPAALYRFNRARYEALAAKGFNFEL